MDPHEFSEARTIGAILTDQASRRRNETFLVFEGRETSYADLLDRARGVAGGFRAMGLRRGDRVGLLLPNVPEFLTAWLGAMLNGLVVVPINPVYTPDEFRYILANAGAAGLVTIAPRCADVAAVMNDLPALRHRISVGGGHDAFVPFEALSLAKPANTSDTGPTPEDPAAIIYTSGTTGHPKGVVLTHRNYHFDAWSLTTHLRASEKDRFLCFLPLYHVNAQVVSVLSALLVGGALILLREFKPAQFLADVARTRATTFSAVPTVYAILNTLPNAAEYDLSSLRYCVCGAAPMPVEVFQSFERTFGARIVEGYGLSEATCGNCVNPLDDGRPRKVGSIGVPLPGQTLAIVDDSGRELADDEVGEIVIKGPAIMREYFQNPAATAEALRDGWLHTGDLGYRDPDGFYFIVGRKKEMIIRGGANIYPKEIEEVLYQHPGVQEAAVIGLPDPIWGETVCACLVPKEGSTLVEEEILERCRQRLAPYKVPARVVLMDRFPKTPTGKIQKNKIVASI
jgi:long-chain acyl-CoA synthetase